MNQPNFHEKRKNPRIQKGFNLKLEHGGAVCEARTSEVSAYGATVELNEYGFRLLSAASKKLADGDGRGLNVFVRTNLNEIDGVITEFFEREGRFFASMKLAEGRTWYSQN